MRDGWSLWLPVEVAWWPGISLKCSARIVTKSCYVPVSLWWQHEECLVLFSPLLLSIICGGIEGKRERDRESIVALCFPPAPPSTHTYTHLSLHPPLSFSLLRYPVFATMHPAPSPLLFIYTCAVKLSLLVFTYSTLHSRGALFMGHVKGQERRYTLQLYSANT